jgi:hypothetical protein
MALIAAIITSEEKTMNRRAFRSPNQSALIFGLLLTSLAGAAVAGESPRLIPRANTSCNNVAATSTLDGAVTLRSEEFVQRGLVNITESTTCNPVVSCQPAYPSCASWSSYSGCGESWCDLEPDCEDCSNCDPEVEFPECLCDPGPAHHEIFERFRVCFNQFGNSCVEWQRTIGYMCGC